MCCGIASSPGHGVQKPRVRSSEQIQICTWNIANRPSETDPGLRLIMPSVSIIKTSGEAAGGKGDQHAGIYTTGRRTRRCGCGLGYTSFGPSCYCRSRAVCVRHSSRACGHASATRRSPQSSSRTRLCRAWPMIFSVRLSLAALVPSRALAVIRNVGCSLASWPRWRDQQAGRSRSSRRQP